MSCFNPISARITGIQPNGKKKITFNGAKDQRDENCIKLPCGKCIGCLRNRAREWSIRCMHESKFHERKCFITLTYADKYLPDGGTLKVEDYQRFMNLLRKKCYREHGIKKIRFFHCGEYGPKLQRPHYHAIIFGYDFPDKRLWRKNGLGQKVYISRELDELWNKGFSTIGDVTKESCEYIARYTLKKVYGSGKEEHYGDKKPEYITMSRKPGIGYCWYEKYKKDVYPQGVLLFNGVKQMPPKYYDSLYEKEEKNRMDEIKEDRKIRAEKVRVWDVINGVETRVSNNDSYRLPVRERIVKSRMEKLKRFMEG